MGAFDSSQLDYLVLFFSRGFAVGLVSYFVGWGTSKLVYTAKMFFRG